jgi:hypothetical protein
MLGLGTSINKGGFVSAASPDPLFLDTYSGAAAAYSLRKLSSSYSGPALQIRRASDNVEVDVSFDSSGVVSLDSPVTNVTEETTGSNTSLVTSATNLGQFVANASYTDADGLGSVDSALVQNWYDQSSNSNDAIQSTAGSQPKIVTNGVIEVENGKPAVQFYGTDDRLLTGVDLLIRGSFSVATATGTGAVFASADFGSEFLRSSNSTQYQLRNGVRMNLATDTTSQSLVYAANDTTSELAVNGATAVTDAGLQTDAFDSLALGSGTAYFLNGNIQEVIIYETNQSDYRTAIEDNINNFYNIYS